MFKSFFYRLNRIAPTKPKTNLINLAKTLVAIFILISITLKIIPILAQEQDPPSDPEVDPSAYDQFVKDIHDAKNNISAESWNANQFDTTAVNICDALMGQCPTTQNISENVSQNGFYLPGGILGTTNNLIAQTYNQPASGFEYLAMVKDNLLGVKPAYAQGVGFVGLEPLLPIWRGFRNVVYLLSTVYFVVLGVMVMFRLKINPQTLLTVQSAVPQVITTLLLVTFSYAIAGLLIDIVYVIQSVVLALLFTVQGRSLNQNLFREFTGTSSLLKQFNFKNLSDANLGDIFRLTSMALPANMIFILGTILGALIGSIIGLFAGGITAGVGALVGLRAGGIIFIVIINILILISMGKFFFGLIKAYVNIIFKIILAPLEIGLGAIPGMKIGFSSWANNLFANLLVFPICLLFLALANIIIEKTSFTTNLWAPNMVKYNLPGTLASLTTGVSGGLVPVAIGFVTILLMSKLPEIIPQVFFAIKPSPIDQAIGQASGSVTKSGYTMGALGGSLVYDRLTGKQGELLKNKAPAQPNQSDYDSAEEYQQEMRRHRGQLNAQKAKQGIHGIMKLWQRGRQEKLIP